jgi:hypothetical protein
MKHFVAIVKGKAIAKQIPFFALGHGEFFYARKCRGKKNLP